MTLIQVTPNGPYGKDVHPAMPVTLPELLADLRACFIAGARGVHLHPRDATGAESLRPAVVNDLVQRVREVARKCGVEVEIGLTTGAWIVPSVLDRVAMIREWEDVDCATVNLSEAGFERVMADILDVGIGVDAAVWDKSEVELLRSSGMTEYTARVSIELETGEPYFLSGSPLVHSQLVNEALDGIDSQGPRLTHGAGEWTWPLVADAIRRGHATRVGFEDSISLPDGSQAAHNAALVEAAKAMRSEASRASS